MVIVKNAGLLLHTKNTKNIINFITKNTGKKIKKK